jgi:hypothetical protein
MERKRAAGNSGARFGHLGAKFGSLGGRPPKTPHNGVSETPQRGDTETPPLSLSLSPTLSLEEINKSQREKETEIPLAPSAPRVDGSEKVKEPKPKKPTKEPAKKYHPAEAFAPGSTGLGQLGFESLVSSAYWPAILGELETVSRNERPEGQQFVGLLKWIRPKLSTELRAQQGGYGRWASVRHGGRGPDPIDRTGRPPVEDAVMARARRIEAEAVARAAAREAKS